MKTKNLDSLIVLRAIAVLAVCFCHFGKSLEGSDLMGQLFGLFGDYGKLGVQIFFVVSGFVIPLSLYASGYQTSDFFRFLQKRLYRLHPPYLIALLITLALGYLSFNVRGLAYPETPLSILESFFYLHAPEDNLVFWTLRVEMEYYLFIGLAYTLFVRFPKASLLLIPPILVVLNQTHLLSLYSVLLTSIAYFLIGIASFMIYTQQGSRLLNYGVLLALFAYIFTFNNVADGVVALVAVSFILGYTGTASRPAQFFGEISYSLYLLHFPIGLRLINLASRYVPDQYNWLLFLIAMLAVTTLAYAFYRFIEKPSAEASKNIRYSQDYRETLVIT